jgi:TetR/AcrR family transcriptional regulator, transcriptional repressor for nem operon
MTRYRKGHKESTRRGIVDVATSKLRVDGIEGARVSDVMREAGLTHGGFYVHFESKDDLVGEACAAGVAAAREAVIAAASRAAPAERVRAVLDVYLTPQRRDSAGCTLATLGGEIARQPESVRARFSEELLKSVDAIAPLMDGVDGRHRGDQVIAMVASMVGAMMLSRAVSDATLSQRILDVGRRAMSGAVERAGKPVAPQPTHRTP